MDSKKDFKMISHHVRLEKLNIFKKSQLKEESKNYRVNSNSTNKLNHANLS